MSNDKQKLMHKVQIYGFALVEANLYLDSHPTCQEGLRYFREHKEKYEKAVAEYEEKYGPLTANASEGKRKWEWVTEPFPWEYIPRENAANEGGER